MIDPLELLAHEDRRHLSCGDGIIFAPPFTVTRVDDHQSRALPLHAEIAS